MGMPVLQVEAIEQPIQLLSAQANHALCRRSWPMEAIFFQALLPQAETIALPIEDLDLVLTPVGEHEQPLGKRVLLQRLLDQYRQAIYPLAEIDRIAAHQHLGQ